MAALFGSFPLAWPKAMQDFFEIQGAVSTAGDYLLNPDCAAPYRTAAELFYDKQIGYLLLPPCLIIIVFIFWITFSYTKHEQWHRTIDQGKGVTERTNLFVKDKFVTTLTVLLYLYLPTAVKQAFALFNCYMVGDGLFLLADLEEPCFEGRHSTFFLFVGIPQLLMFVVGFPGIGFYFLTRNRKRLSEFAPKARYSLFYAGYRDARYFWELLVVFRKVSVIAISVFFNGINPELQALVLLLLLLLLLGIQSVGKPFRETIQDEDGNFASLKILMWLELSMLFMLLLTLWAGLMLFKLKTSSTKEILTVVIVVVNILFVIYLAFTLLSQCWREKREKNNVVVLKVDAVRNSITKFARKSLPFLHVWSTEAGGSGGVDRAGAVGRRSRMESSEVTMFSNKLTIEMMSITSSEVKEKEEPLNEEISIDCDNENDNKNDGHRRNSTDMPEGWDKYYTDDGSRYYHNSGGDQSTSWVAPPGSTGGSVDRARRKLSLRSDA